MRQCIGPTHQLPANHHVLPNRTAPTRAKHRFRTPRQERADWLSGRRMALIVIGLSIRVGGYQRLKAALILDIR